MKVNHCTFCKPIRHNIKLHQSSSLCEVLMFWLALLVTHTEFENEASDCFKHGWGIASTPIYIAGKDRRQLQKAKYTLW